MAAPTIEKAKITNLNNNKEQVFHFNPAEFEIGQTLSWTANRSIGANAPTMIFGGGHAQDLSITLLFDTTAPKPNEAQKDVRDEYKNLVEMAQVDTTKKNAKTGKSEPPLCRFQWGRFLAFNAVIISLKQKFLMFTASGLPLRAEVSITLKQVGETERPQNPTSRSEARKVWQVEEEQRLDWIAYKEYGDPAQWRHIAETNDLDNPTSLQPGQMLKLTPLRPRE